MFRTLVVFFSLLLTSLTVFAQEASAEVEMADRLRADGKIWVVVGVIAVTFFGIIFYLTRLDSKISKLEREIRK